MTSRIIDQKYHILVIDDNVAIHEDFRKILLNPTSESRDLEDIEALLFDTKTSELNTSLFHIDCASQGQEGLEMVKRTEEDGCPYALAFVDGRMPPGWDGVETIKQLWNVCPDLQVVLCTAYADYSWQEIRETLGESDSLLILKKPFDNVEVLQLTHALTRKWELNKEVMGRLSQLATVVVDSNDAIIIQDLNGNITAWNKAAVKMYGYSEAEALTKNIVDLVPLDKKTEVFDFIRKLQEEEVESFESQRITKDGIVLDVWLTVTALIDKYGKPVSITTTERDITARKREAENLRRIEGQLQQSQKMETIGTLAGGIAHDFNNILSVILGFAELAKVKCQPGTAIVNDLDEVLAASNKAKELVKRILAFSRQDDLDCKILQPATIVGETLKMLRPSLSTTVSINQNLELQTGCIFADPTQIHQIIMNLCTNSLHAMEETGGKLDVILKKVILTNEELAHEPDVAGGAFIQISIVDSGSGIAPAIKDKIFEPYFTTKEVGKGTGMGLAMVHGIVKNYGGVISFQSGLGEGTVFHVFLPIVEQDALPENKNNEQILFGKERILFIDDEEVVVKMGQTMLEMLGYRVTISCSSLEALETFQNQPDQFDLVITDQTMPGMTGSDLSRRMLQIRPDIPIILCTGYSAIIAEKKAKDIGIKEFAFKPLSGKDIAKLIRKVLDVS